VTAAAVVAWLSLFRWSDEVRERVSVGCGFLLLINPMETVARWLHLPETLPLLVLFVGMAGYGVLRGNDHRARSEPVPQRVYSRKTLLTMTILLSVFVQLFTLGIMMAVFAPVPTTLGIPLRTLIKYSFTQSELKRNFSFSPLLFSSRHSSLS
jgi:hypothetical protein